MITAISGLNLKRINPQNNSKTDFKTTPLKSDSFELQQKSNPSFGRSIVPRKAIFACCDRFSARMERTQSVDELRKLSDRFIERLRKILYNPKLQKEPEFERYNYFKHDLINVFTNEKLYDLTKVEHDIILEKYPEVAEMPASKYLATYKQAFRDTVRMIKSEIEYEKYEYDNSKIVNAKAIFGRLRKHRLKLCPFSIEGLSLLKGKKVKKPVDLYYLLKQPFLNAQKYGERKPFRIVIEKAEVDGKDRYYALYINPETTPISDADIDKILEGNGYRISNDKITGIEGEGFGFGYIISTLRKKGYERDIPNLIQKGREKGVCVRIPIIGIV